MQPSLPRFITFTGADDQTSIEAMLAISARFPVEWGILFSASQQGNGRYPSMQFIERLCAAHGIRLAAHLCGRHSRDLLAHGRTEVDNLLLKHFERVQINTAAKVDTMTIAAWAKTLDALPIIQCRDEFPSDPHVLWLYDASGGRGVVPGTWPDPYPGGICGYAGGHRPDNVVQAIQDIGQRASNYWIDMETGVRDSSDRFDVQRCERVCVSVYGA
jgi:hypothetical protein